MLRSCSRCGKIHKPGCCTVAKPSAAERTPEQKFRSSADWQRVAEAVRERDLNMCVACRHKQPAVFVTQSLEVHHIIPLRVDWSLRLEEDNCATLCIPCHKLAEQGIITAQQLRDWIAEDARANPAG